VTSPKNGSDLGMYYVLKGTDTRCELFDSVLIIHDELETKMGSVDDENETSFSCNLNYLELLLYVSPIIHEYFNSDDTGENEGSVDARCLLIWVRLKRFPQIHTPIPEVIRRKRTVSM